MSPHFLGISNLTPKGRHRGLFTTLGALLTPTTL